MEDLDLYQIERAVNKAKETLRNADKVAGTMASLIRGRLKNVPSYVLADLKKELKDFNIHTGRWMVRGKK